MEEMAETEAILQALKPGEAFLWEGDCREFLGRLSDRCVDAVVTDPPYGLGFMGQAWDRAGIAFDPSFWAEVLRVLKPGGHLLAAGIGRTHHRMMVAVEDAGFEIRDCIYHIFGSGFPKNLDVSKAIDKLKGAERPVVGRYAPPEGGEWRLRQADDPSAPGSGGMFTASGRRTLDVTAPATEEAARWEGFGTALKPAVEIWVLARRPLSEASVAENVLKWGTGALNIDGCRIAWGRVPRIGEPGWGGRRKRLGFMEGGHEADRMPPSPLGRWPANLVLSHSEECVFGGYKRAKAVSGGTGEASKRASGIFNAAHPATGGYGDRDGMEIVEDWKCAPGCPVRLLDAQAADLQNGFPGATIFLYGYGLSRAVSRFFYCAKVSRSERWGFCRDCGAAVPPEELDVHRGRGHRVAVHPTQKPFRLMRWLVRLVTPPGGLVLDPFAGSGTTLVAAILEGFRALGCERDPEYAAVARARVAAAVGRGWDADESGPVVDVPRQMRIAFD
ncbi:MAG: DNA methyltransferase [Moorellales bacterium]